jgi:hypothetical protein
MCRVGQPQATPPVAAPPAAFAAPPRAGEDDLLFPPLPATRARFRIMVIPGGVARKVHQRFGAYQ